MRADIAIVTALKDELDALTSLCGNGRWQRIETGSFSYFICNFNNPTGEPMALAAARTNGMGSNAATRLATLLSKEVQPRCMAMSGICAGNRDRLSAGDLVVADRVFRYDGGEQRRVRRNGKEVVEHWNDLKTFNLKPRWRHAVEEYVPCWLQSLAQSSSDTDSDVSRSLFVSDSEHFGSMRVHLGAMATGEKVIKDGQVFDRLKPLVRNVYALDMEAAAVAAVAEAEGLPWLIVKAVTDFADMQKNDYFRSSASWASASFLIGFLLNHLPASGESECHGKPLPYGSWRNDRQLKAFLQERLALQIAGLDTGTVDTRILERRRNLRANHLKSGDLLDDDRFLLLQYIGKGGFAEVWKAFDRQEEQPVAIKILHHQYARDQTRIERFFRGARAMTRFRHPNIVAILKREGHDEGRHYFVMEYVDGLDFQRFILQHGKVPLSEVVDVIEKVGYGLVLVHESGIIHRDIKPSNILLGRDGSVRLTDFDLAIDPESTGGTRTGQNMGTFVFAAPEILIDARMAVSESDIYSLAVSTIFALCGHKIPQFHHDREEIIKGLDCPPAVKRVLLESSSRNIKERPPSVGAFCQALRKAAQTLNPGSPPRKQAVLPDVLPLDPESSDGPWLARDPLGNDLFRRFMTADGYQHRPYWCGEGWHWKEQSATLEPWYWRDRAYNGDLSPVVGISHFEAEAFCRWLTIHLAEVKPDWWREGMLAGLPSFHIYMTVFSKEQDGDHFLRPDRELAEWCSDHRGGGLLCFARYHGGRGKSGNDEAAWRWRGMRRADTGFRPIISFPQQT